MDRCYFFDANDQVCTLDFNSNGNLDHLCCYHPGGGIFWVIQNLMGGFSSIYQGWPEIGVHAKYNALNLVGQKQQYIQYVQDGVGIGGYEPSSTTDRCFAIDFNSSRLRDHIVMYRPGGRSIWVFKRVSKFYPFILHN